MKTNSTLEEPVCDTILRDLGNIWFKLKYVLNPVLSDDRAEKLRDCI